MIKLLFWAFVALDVAALLFFFVLGLAAAGSSRTHPLMVVLMMLILPSIPLLASVWIFLRASSPLWRALAFVLVAAPLVYVMVTKLTNDARIRANSNAQGELTFFATGPQRDLVEAIRRNDLQALAAALPRANVNASGMEGMTPLVMALRQMRSTPTQHDTLKALLTAGADPNTGTQYELPLEMALQIAAQSGPAPVAMLLAARADPNRKNASGVPIFFSAAGLGAHPDSLGLLLKHGVDLRATGRAGETVLIYAATAHSWRAVALLLEAGADPQQGRSAKGMSLSEMVDEAVRQGQARAASGGKSQEDVHLRKVVSLLGKR